LKFSRRSDHTISVDKQRWTELFSHYTIDGMPTLNLGDAIERRRLHEVLSLADTLDAPDHAQEMRMERGDSLRLRLRGVP